MSRTLLWMASAAAVLVMSRPVGSVANADDAPLLGEVRMESVRLSNVDTESVHVAVRLSAIANANATFQSLVFDQLTIGSLKVTLPPARGPIQLREGQPITGLPTLEARLGYREVDSLEPLRRIISDGRARVRGVLRGRLDLNLFQKLALRATSSWVVSRVDQEVPVELTGGVFAQVAGLAALTLAEPLWAAGRAVQERSDATRVERARAAVDESLVSLETSYEMTARDGTVTRFRHVANGFLVDGDSVLAPAEAVEPWLFDEALAEAVENRELSVALVDLIATPWAPAATPREEFSLQQQQLRVVRTLNGSERVISPTTRRPFRVRFRDNNDNAALLKIQGRKGRGRQPADNPPGAGWQPATIVRANTRDGATGPAFWQTSVRWDNDRYQIRDSVDPAAFGSPIWTDAGIVGLVQDETSGADAAALLKRLDR